VQKISVVIPCRNEERYIKSCIEAVLASDYGAGNLEVIVVDGMSDDKTREIVKDESAKHSNVSLVDNTAKLTPFAFNLGINKASGNYIAIVGARHIISANYLSACVGILNSDTKIVCAGGMVDNVYENETSRLIATAMASPFGVGGGNFRIKREDAFVDTVGTPVYKADVFKDIGLFDEELARNQDDDFNFRVIKKGYEIFITAKATIRYFVRASYKNLFRQYYQYGYWKVYVNKKHKTVTTLRQLGPIGLILFLIFGGIAVLINKMFLFIYLPLLMLYVSMAFVAAIVNSKRAKELPLLLLAFFTLHSSYGLGYLQGIIHFFMLNKGPSLNQTTLSR